MSILQVCAFAAPTPGNFMLSLLELERCLNERGISTIYAFPERARDKKWCMELQKKSKVYFLPEYKARIRITTYREFFRIYKENEIDVVHSHFELYDIPATLMAPRKVKVFWHLHDALKENYKKAVVSRRILTKMQYGWFSRRATLLSVSKEHGKFAADLGFPKRKIEYLPNGLNTTRIDLEGIDASQDKNQFLLFGWEVHRKGVDLIVEAAKKMSKRDMKIKIVGQDKCECYLRERAIPEQIVFSRPVEDVNELYKQTAVFLHISRAEGLSYALLEAIYAGLPVICSDIPENQFAKEFRDIVWIEKENISDLVKALDLTSGTITKQPKENIMFNRERIVKSYSLDVWVQRIIEYYMK